MNKSLHPVSVDKCLAEQNETSRFIHRAYLMPDVARALPRARRDHAGVTSRLSWRSLKMCLYTINNLASWYLEKGLATVLVFAIDSALSNGMKVSTADYALKTCENLGCISTRTRIALGLKLGLVSSGLHGSKQWYAFTLHLALHPRTWPQVFVIPSVAWMRSYLLHELKTVLWKGFAFMQSSST